MNGTQVSRRALAAVRAGRTQFISRRGEWWIIGPADHIWPGEYVGVTRADRSTVTVVVDAVMSRRIRDGVAYATATFRNQFADHPPVYTRKEILRIGGRSRRNPRTRGRLYLERVLWAPLIDLKIVRYAGYIQHAELGGEKIACARAAWMLGSVAAVWWNPRDWQIYIDLLQRNGEDVAERIRVGIAKWVADLSLTSHTPTQEVFVDRHPVATGTQDGGGTFDAGEIISARRADGWTRGEIAAAVGVSRQAISYWERGIQPAPDNAARLAALPATPPGRAAPVGVDVDVDVVQAVTDLRIAGWSFAQIARNVGVTGATVAEWGKGTKKPQPDRATRLKELVAALPPLPPPPPDDFNLAETLKTLRDAGWTIRWISSKLDVGQAMVDRWLNGKAHPKLDKATQLAALVNMSPPVPLDFDAATAIADLRTAGWTLRQIGHEIEVAAKTVWRWQQGRSQPTPATAARLAALVNTPPPTTPRRAIPEPTPVPPDFDAATAIADLRTAGWTLRQIGEAVDAPDATVYMWQRRHRPQPDSAARLYALVNTPPPVPPDFDAAAAIADLRAADWTLHQIGQEVGVADTTVYRWQKGDHRLTPANTAGLIKLHQRLSTPDGDEVGKIGRDA